MAIIASNIIIGAPVVKEEPKSILKTIEEIKKNNEAIVKQEARAKKHPVRVEKRSKLSDPKPDRKSAYVRDMTTVHKI
jgi:hypothetical protein